MMKILTFAALLGLSACTDTEKLAACTGPSFALNAGHWQPSTADVEISAPGRVE